MDKEIEKAGCEAGKRYDSVDTCPYRPGSAEWYDWCAGWLSGIDYRGVA